MAIAPFSLPPRETQSAWISATLADRRQGSSFRAFVSRGAFLERMFPDSWLDPISFYQDCQILSAALEKLEDKPQRIL